MSAPFGISGLLASLAPSLRYMRQKKKKKKDRALTMLLLRSQGPSQCVLSPSFGLPMFVLYIMSQGFVALRGIGESAPTPSSQQHKSCIFLLISKKFRHTVHGFCY